MLRINRKNIWNDRDWNPKPTAVEHSTGFFLTTYKYSDQILQTVENKTTVLIPVFKEVLQTSIPPLIFILYAGGCHDFLMKHFRLTVPKNFVEEPVCVSETFGYRKTLCIRGDITNVYRKNVVSQYRKISKGNTTVIEKILVSKSFMDEKGVSRFSVEHFRSQNAEKIRGHLFNVSENLGYRKNLCIIGGITFFPRKILVSQCKRSRGHPFNISQKLGYGKFYASEREGVSRFSVEKFCQTVPKIFVGEHFGVSENFVYRKSLCIARGYH